MTTPYTPKLIPAELPPNVDPELTEPYYRRTGEAIRTTAMRTHEAVCLDPECPAMWVGTNAFPESTKHTSSTGHLVRQYYYAEYVMQINPLHPKHRGKVRTTIDHSSPDIPPELAHLYAQKESYKEPDTSPRRAAREVRNEARRELSQTARDVLARVSAAEARSARLYAMPDYVERSPNPHDDPNHDCATDDFIQPSELPEEPEN